MQTINYILKDIKPISLKSRTASIQALFDNYAYSHLPVVDSSLYMGALERREFELLPPDDTPLMDHRHLIQPFYATESMNWFEVLQNFATYNSNLVPVLDANKKYLGYYELDDFLNLFKCTPFLHEEGVILVIAKNVNDYSFSEISQIVEANNATLFGAFVSKIQDDIAQIILKLSPHDINNTLLSFRRYKYEIINEFEKDKYIEELNARSDYLQKYLNI